MTRFLHDHVASWIVSAVMLGGMAVTSTLIPAPTGTPQGSLTSGIQAAHTVVSSYQDPAGRFVVYRRIAGHPGS